MKEEEMQRKCGETERGRAGGRKFWRRKARGEGGREGRLSWWDIGMLRSQPSEEEENAEKARGSRPARRSAS